MAPVVIIAIGFLKLLNTIDDGLKHFARSTCRNVAAKERRWTGAC
jgi:hypothetical protein